MFKTCLRQVCFKMSIKERLKKIKLLILDVDGVLTDGRIIYDSEGKDLKFFDVSDGLGVYLLKKANIKTVLVSAKSSKTIRYRAQDMGIKDIFEDVVFKKEIYEKLLHKFSVKEEEVCVVGDDLLDLGIMSKAGLAVAVANAAEEIKKQAHYITKREGGRGAIREIAEMILKAQGKWQELLRLYQG